MADEEFELTEIEFVDPPDRGPRCETCRFYSKATEAVGGGGSRDLSHGLCERFPPRASTDRQEFAFWPKVLSEDWCGEHEPPVTY